MDSELKRVLTENMYTRLREIPGQGVCGLQQMLFTVGLFCHLDPVGYQYRYCYPTLLEAVAALEDWNGEGHPPGPWIKRKGKGGDIPNPELPDEYS